MYHYLLIWVITAAFGYMNSWIWFFYCGTGIDSTDVKLLDSYTVYSQSKEKAASRFYIMQCSQSQSVSQEVNPFPLKDVIERFA